MKYIKKYNETWNPILNKEVNDYVQKNKYNLPELWNKNLTDDENIEFLINYFTKYPDQMKSKEYNFHEPNNKGDFRNNAPILQKIGGINDFRTFNTSN